MKEGSIDEVISGKADTFNGKPLAYWQQMADEYVVESLLRLLVSNRDCQQWSIVNRLAAKKLEEILSKEDQNLVHIVLSERNKCIAGFYSIMKDIFRKDGR